MLTIIAFNKIMIGSYLTYKNILENMANTAQAKKRARQAENSRIRNTGQRSNLRTFVKRVIAAISADNKEQAGKAYQDAVATIDKAVSKGLIHKNKAARSKSRLNNKVRAMV